ncbi:hypothetical protein CBR_g26348 [Chara braunii]|uniref:Uncharacterized protein n=1 Tax=Chara braunii TaxID=69332 RepID=A0A388L7N6_CHABU|nr:hypothetical protein CBR_g26348 [Chara braunii]|eukprot:GBG78319.1 hypothetical protein CBR_g26348 [Chara braunii]
MKAMKLRQAESQCAMSSEKKSPQQTYSFDNGKASSRTKDDDGTHDLQTKPQEVKESKESKENKESKEGKESEESKEREERRESKERRRERSERSDGRESKENMPRSVNESRAALQRERDDLIQDKEDLIRSLIKASKERDKLVVLLTSTRDIFEELQARTLKSKDIIHRYKKIIKRTTDVLWYQGFMARFFTHWRLRTTRKHKKRAVAVLSRAQELLMQVLSELGRARANRKTLEDSTSRLVHEQFQEARKTRQMLEDIDSQFQVLRSQVQTCYEEHRRPFK